MGINWLEVFVTLFIGAIGFYFRHYIRAVIHVWRKQGTKALIKKIYTFIKKKCVGVNVSPVEQVKIEKEMTIPELLNKTFISSRPIQYLKVPSSEFRLNVVTDSLAKGSYFGGVATSMILATLFSNKFDIPLRVITRFAKTNPRDYFSFLEFMKIPTPKKVEFFSDTTLAEEPSKFKLELSDKDIFLSTSWWSTQVVQGINMRPSFFYILQEVEKFFYPNGDEEYFAEQTLRDPRIHYFINSKMLYEYYKQNHYTNLLERSMVFEPAFPEHLYHAKPGAFERKTGDKKKLFFYARPTDHHRNLFYTGLKFLDEALSKGIIGDDWEIYFAGSSHIPSVVFSNGRKPKILGIMDWKGYLEFIKDVDLCLSLMNTPHPSYIPLDMAAVGGVTLTNQHSTKLSVPYSQNIICEPLESQAFMQGFKKAIQLSQNHDQRRENYSKNQLETSWNRSMESILDYMYENK